MVEEGKARIEGGGHDKEEKVNSMRVYENRYPIYDLKWRKNGQNRYPIYDQNG